MKIKQQEIYFTYCGDKTKGRQRIFMSVPKFIKYLSVLINR